MVEAGRADVLVFVNANHSGAIVKGELEGGGQNNCTRVMILVP